MELGRRSLLRPDGFVTDASRQGVAPASLCAIYCARDVGLSPVDGSVQLCDASDGSQASDGGMYLSDWQLDLYWLKQTGPGINLKPFVDLLWAVSIDDPWDGVCMQKADGGKGEISAAYEVFNELIGVFTPMIWVSLLLACRSRKISVTLSSNFFGYLFDLARQQFSGH
jgi:hypothetical protein